MREALASASCIREEAAAAQANVCLDVEILVSTRTEHAAIFCSKKTLWGRGTIHT